MDSHQHVLREVAQKNIRSYQGCGFIDVAGVLKSIS